MTSRVTRAVSVGASTASGLEAGPGASPRAALHKLCVRPLPSLVAKELLVRKHYLHSMPGGTRLSFGVFDGGRLMGALTLGVGPKLGHRRVKGATTEDCSTLTRLWLSDELPRNSESRVIGVVLRALKRHTCLKFVLAYAPIRRLATWARYIRPQAGCTPGRAVLAHAAVRPGRWGLRA